jgi:hypothetical protein
MEKPGFRPPAAPCRNWFGIRSGERDFRDFALRPTTFQQKHYRPVMFLQQKSAEIQELL